MVDEMTLITIPPTIPNLWQIGERLAQERLAQERLAQERLAQERLGGGDGLRETRSELSHM